MGNSAQVPLSQVWEMLATCAKGYERKATEHYWRVMWQGRTYPTLPLGAHGRRKDEEVMLGKVRQLVRQLRVDEKCAAGKIPALAT